MKEIQELIKRVEVEINKTPTGELRNLLCDANIVLQQQALNIGAVSGMLPLTKEHQCFELGHAFYLVCEIDNGRSKYGEHKCSRCGHVEPFQYDYGSW